ncbi:MAG: hypothetical protein ACRDRZ_16640 [Pseudonocardiaceae bacterium]
MSADRHHTTHQRAAYRRYIRENHPDVGGDPQAFAAGLAQLRVACQPGAPRPRDRYDAPVVIVSGTDRMRRRMQRLWRRVHRRPGSARVH